MVKKAVLFDLYGTLLCRKKIEEDHLERAFRYVYFFLQSRGCTVDFDCFRNKDEEVFMRMANRRKDTLQEIDLRSAYMEILPKIGVSTSDEIIDGCIEAFGKPLVSIYELCPEIDYILRTLKEKGYALAIVSNAQAAYARRDLRQLGISHLFDAIVLSSEVGWVKPHEAMFLTALEKLGVTVSETVMVGDRFDEDIIGAKKMGMKTVLVTRTKEQDMRFEIEPDLIISNLSELIEHLDNLI